ncbi:Ig-like domain-containing protein [Pseudomonas baetica]|uniref:Ig-like domain-containing protein n=1 Tax=Pseudomonas baetica TaxID=674054 RepID=UPI002871DC33|nr:Ig-like domain-containing protein [Pseudomonas baetica]MDR9861387.1 Ig-like domain-containing protein [Pseudomonas baetica]
MDIQSAVLNQLFALFPVIIQGWITPVRPAGIAHGGIPQVLYDGQLQGLLCLIDPWPELQLQSWTMAVDDRVDLYINDDPTPVAGVTIQPGEETLRQRLYIPHGYLRQGVNRLHYKVIRAGGNTSEDSRDLLVLYHLRTPDNLDLVIPPDVIKDGVSAERAAQGVELRFFYNNRRPYDRIRLRIGDTQVDFDVPDGNAPITHTLFTEAFRAAGDNSSAVVDFIVTDQLGNPSKSPEKRLDIHLDRLNLQAPTVKDQSGDNFSPTQPEVRVLVPRGSLLPTDTLSVIWQGATGAPPNGSYTSPQRLVSAGLEIAVPRSVLAYSLGKPVTVTYVIDREGVPTTSLTLTLNILALPATALISPKIVEADDNNFLDVMALEGKDATIHGLLHTLIEAGQQVWMSVEGKKVDGSVHNLPIWNGGNDQVNTTWVNQGFWPVALPNSYLKELGHGTALTIKYKVSMDKSNNPATAAVFPDRLYTIKAVPAFVVDTTPIEFGGIVISLKGSGLRWTATVDPEHTITIRQASGGTPPYAYSSTAPEVATVDQTGAIRSVGRGKATITVSDSRGQERKIPVSSDVRSVSIRRTQSPIYVLEYARWADSLGGRDVDAETAAAIEAYRFTDPDYDGYSAYIVGRARELSFTGQGYLCSNTYLKQEDVRWVAIFVYPHGGAIKSHRFTSLCFFDQAANGSEPNG